MRRCASIPMAPKVWSSQPRPACYTVIRPPLRSSRMTAGHPAARLLYFFPGRNTGLSVVVVQHQSGVRSDNRDGVVVAEPVISGIISVGGCEDAAAVGVGKTGAAGEDAEVQMTSRYIAGGPHLPENISRLHPLSDGNADAAVLQVTVGGVEHLPVQRVTDQDDVPMAAALGGGQDVLYNPFGSRGDRRGADPVPCKMPPVGRTRGKARAEGLGRGHDRQGVVPVQRVALGERRLLFGSQQPALPVFSCGFNRDLFAGPSESQSAVCDK